MMKPQPDAPSPGELAVKASKPFSNEPDGYRKARKALLAEEMALRSQLWFVAEQRRKLPLSLTDMRGATPEPGGVAHGEFLRWFAGAAWYPTSLLSSQGVRWN